MATKRRLIDFVIYVSVGLTVVAVAVAYAIFAVKTGRDNEDVLPWIFTIAAAAVSFGYLLWLERKLWHNVRFWLLCAALLVIHFVVCLKVFVWFAGVPLLWMVALIGPELLVLDACVRTVLKRVV